MESSRELGRVVRFGAFEVDLQAGELRKNGVRLRLPAQPFQVLAFLLECPGKVVTREELCTRIWPADTFVDFDHSLGTAINKIREALCDTAQNPRFIETVPRRGYRFIAPLSEVPVPSATRNKFALLDRKSRVAVALAVVAVAFVAVLLGFNVGGLRRRVFGTSASSRIHSLAVLPLKNLSGDPSQDYFADGMTEQLTTDLGEISALRVISRTSAMQYQGSHRTLPDIARDLHVDAIVEGSVERSGDEIRITAQLIDAATDRHLWAKSYERNLRDVLALQDEVAQAIANEVRIKLTSQEQIQLTSAHPVNPQAHEAYLRGLYELHGMTAETTDTLRSQSLEKAVGYFQQALTADPNDAMAYSGLADAYSGLSTHYKAPLDVMPKAKQAAEKAIELDDGLADAHASLGYVLLTYDWEWARAEHEFRRALQLNASLARAHAGYAEYLLFVARRTDEAVQELERAYSLDPLLPLSHGDSAWLLFLAKRYSQSIEASQRVGHDEHILALSYAELGRSQEAIAAADRASKTTQNPVILSQVAAAYALAGAKDKSRAMLPGIESQARQRYVCGFNVACIYSVLGDKEKALAWLGKAYVARSD